MDGHLLGTEHIVETGELRAYSVTQRLSKCSRAMMSSAI